MTDAFFQAAFCQPPKVLGRQLCPFSLSHAMLLRGLGNRIVAGEPGDREELFQAVLVCSRGHRENARLLFGGKLSALGLTWWARRWPPAKAAPEREAFSTYLADYCRVPERWESGAGGKTFRAPWPFHFVHVLTRYYGMDFYEAWDTPVSLARCCYDVWAETEGDNSLVTAREAALIAMANEQEG